MKAYAWPGNVRELENVVERGVILAKGPGVGEEDLPERLRRSEPAPAALPSFDLEVPLPEVIRRLTTAVEKEYLRRLLKRFEGHLGLAAAHAGLSRRTLYNKLTVHGLKREGRR
jgi:DNA-binding NtrC family response regulator